MKFTRKISIGYKIITEENLKELAQLIVDEAKYAEGKARLELGYEGGYSEAEGGLTIFESTNFGKKRLRYAIFSMRDWRNHKGIMVQLHHGSIEESYILIEGEDPDWVRGKVKLFEEIKQSWKKRYFPSLSPIAKVEGHSIYMFLIIFLYLEAMLLGLSGVLQNPEKKSGDLFFFVSGIFLLLLFLFLAINHLWPCVELDVRPSRLSAQRKMIISVISIIGTILIGLVTNFLYDHFFK
ncbi:hypothetical protein [Planifilum fimeticola]